MAYILVTILALDYLHDSWFYWTHRWLHSRLLYKHIHTIHHRCAPVYPCKSVHCSQDIKSHTAVRPCMLI